MNDTIYDAPRPIPGSHRWQRETLARVIGLALMEDEFSTDEKVFLHGLGQVIDLAFRPDPRLPRPGRWPKPVGSGARWRSCSPCSGWPRSVSTCTCVAAPPVAAVRPWSPACRRTRPGCYGP